MERNEVHGWCVYHCLRAARALHEQVDLQVVQLTSTKTQIPFDYYKAPYCNIGEHVKEAENLGEVSALRASRSIWIVVCHPPSGVDDAKLRVLSQVSWLHAEGDLRGSVA